MFDPVSGLAEFSYDPNGTNTFNKSDVNQDGVVDLNDAILVDNSNGLDYANLADQAQATQQAPVTGDTIPLNLALVKQSDSSTIINSSDVAVVNSQLTGIGNTNWYGYNLQKTGPGTITWARTGGAVTVYSGASVEISGGTLQIGGTEDPFTDNNAPGVGSTAGNHVAVTVNNGGKLQFIQNALTSTVASLTVDTASNSVVDIGNNALIIDYGATDPAATIRSYIVSGYAGGTWTGAGINSSVAAASSHYGVGYADGADGVVSGLSSGQIEVKYTLYGDANLDGVVNGTDFGILAASFGQQASAWDKGDFTYDGVVNGSDFGLLAANFGQQSNGVAGGITVQRLDRIGHFRRGPWPAGRCPRTRLGGAAGAGRTRLARPSPAKSVTGLGFICLPGRHTGCLGRWFPDTRGRKSWDPR